MTTATASKSGAELDAPPSKKIKTGVENGACNEALWVNVPSELPENMKEWLPLFERTLTELVDSSAKILAEKLSYGVKNDVKEHIVSYYKKCFLHSILGGKMTRGLTVLYVVNAFGKGKDPKAVRRGFIAGALVELLQAFFLVMDDVMDKSVTRRGKPCWYKMDGVTEVNAVNDSICLEAIMYALVKRYFADDTEMKLALYETLHENTFMTILGQHIDTNSITPGKDIDLSIYTMGRWDAQVMYKTGFYTFFLPAMCGVITSGEELTPAVRHNLVESCLELGRLFQGQDDYLDAYADPEVLGKIGTDIQDGKCSWLLSKALEKANEAQRSILEKNVNIDNKENIAAVKEVFVELDLEAEWLKTESEMAAVIKEKYIECEVLPKPLRNTLGFLIGKLANRKK